MDPTARAMFMGASGAGIPIGTFLEGGYFAGYISYTADGNATHGLIVAPAASGYNNQDGLLWKTTETSTSNPTPDSDYDGASNTLAMVSLGRATQHPAAKYCANLSINGYSDWYLPARYELEIAYYNLKPTTRSNRTDVGANSYAVPQRLSNYTAGDPAQTSVAAFREGGAEDFAIISVYSGSSSTYRHWSSTEGSANNAWSLQFNTGFPTANGASMNPDSGALERKNSPRGVRAFRKFAL